MHTIYQLILDTCNKYTDKFLFDDKITFKQTLEYVRSRAAYLQKSGIKKGDIVGLLGVNSPQWCITHMAICSTGAIVLPLDNNLSAAVHLEMLKKVNARHLFLSDEYKNRKDNSLTIHNISLNEAFCDSKYFKVPELAENDIASLLFTSGTTDHPKIVQLTHANIVKTGISAINFMEVTQADTMLAILPLYHVYALEANIYAPFAGGCGIVFQPSMKGPDLIKSLQEHQITIFAGVPQLWELLFEGIKNKVKSSSFLKFKIFMLMAEHGEFFKKIGLGFLPGIIFKPVQKTMGGNIRFLLSGAASLKPQYYKYYSNMGFKIVEGYGLTETTGPICATRLTESRPGIVGKTIPGNEIEIRNKNSIGIGEIWMRGEAVMPGYYKNEKANKEVFDKAGWFNSGDIGFIDDKGDLHITGRMKNVIVLDSGKNVYPEELEAFYQESEKIREIAIFGRNIDDKETVYAVIVPVNPMRDTYQEIKEEIMNMNKNLPSYKTISHFALSIEPLPRTSTKKIIIRDVVGRLDQGLFQTHADNLTQLTLEFESQSPLEDLICDKLKNKLKAEKIYSYESLEDYNIDSLGRIALMSELENELNIQINVADFLRLQNIQELIRYLAGCNKKSGESVLLDLLDGKIRTKIVKLYNPVVSWLIALIYKSSPLLWKLNIVEGKNLKVDNCILVCNHQSNLDTIWVLGMMPYKIRKNVYIIGKKEVAFLRFIFPGLRTIYVERKGNVYPALKAGADLLRQGKSLLIFPEGTRTKDGTMGNFKTGAAFLAKKLNKNIIPITIKDSYKIFPRGSFLPRLFTKNKVEIFVHKTIDSNSYQNIEELNEKIKNVIRSKL
ncbi:MAG: AMP-binding protein [Candidatus Margulisbacteria bacterium]|nr:AMP-binding protein [Candidatus Margulisiibacteriota bacterium]